MARLIYNGIELSYIATQAVTQEPVLDDSGTDVMYWRFRLRVRAVVVSGQSGDALQAVWGGGMPIVPPALTGEYVADVVKRVRHQLLTPRRTLKYWSDYGDDRDALLWVEAAPAAGGQAFRTDCNNGPRPLRCDVTRASEYTLLIDFDIETSVLDCPLGAAQPPPWVAHRWSETQQLDGTGATVELTRRGVIVARSDVLGNADFLRALVIPKPPKGFAWARVSYSLRADGLALAYEFTWREVWLHAPFPAYEAQGEYSETCVDMAQRQGECWVRLKTFHTGDKIQLIALAVSVCLGKLIGQRLFNENQVNAFVGQLALKESLYEPVVEARMRVSYKPEGRRNDGLAVVYRQFSPQLVLAGAQPKIHPDAADPTKPLPGTWERDVNRDAPSVPLRGFQAIALVAAALHDPCTPDAIANRPDLALATAGNPRADVGHELRRAEEGPRGDPPTGSDRYTEAPPVEVGSTLRLESTGGVPVSLTIEPYELNLTTDGGYKDEKPGVYEQYFIRKTYLQQRFDLVLPVCKKDAPAQLVELAPPLHFCQLVFSAVKDGGVPAMPDCKALPATWKLVGTPVLHTSDPTVLADGKTLRHGIAGEMVFAILDSKNSYLAPPLPSYFMPDQTYSSTPVVEKDTFYLQPPGYQTRETMADLLAMQDATAPPQPPAQGT